MAQVQTGKPTRKNSFDAVRLIAACSVLVAHQLNIAGYELQGYGQPTLGPFGPKLADAGLYVFFALSGYLVFQSLDADPRLGRFLSARALRIYPGAVVNIVACVVFGAFDTILLPSSYWRDPETWKFLFHNAFILWTPTQFQLPGVMSESRFPSVNVPLWTLKYELLCYGTLLLLYKCSVRIRLPTRAVPLLMASIMTAAFVFTRVFPPHDGGGLETLGSYKAVHVVRFFMVFFFGAAYAACEPWPLRTTAWLSLVLGCLSLVCPFAEVCRAVAILLIGLTAIEIGKSSFFYSECYHKLGDLSYGVYLYAFPVQMLTLGRWINRVDFCLISVIDVIAITTCALLSWRFVERPALKWKQGRRQLIGSVGIFAYDNPPASL